MCVCVCVSQKSLFLYSKDLAVSPVSRHLSLFKSGPEKNSEYEKQACKLQDVQAEKLTSLKAQKLKNYNLTNLQAID